MDAAIRIRDGAHDASVQRVKRFNTVAIAAWVTFIPFYLHLGARRICATSCVALVCCASVQRWMTHRDAAARATTAASVILVIASLTVSTNSLMSGGLSSPVAPYLGCVPLSAAFLLGRRATLIWTLVTATLIGAIAVAEPHVTPEVIFHGPVQALTVVGAVLAIAAIALAHEAVNAELLSAQTAYQRDLAAARDEALAASTAKSEFLATMSHEIRTPLNGVLGMADLLGETPLTEEQREFVSTLRGSGTLLMTLLNDLLDFSKIEAGRLELERAPFELRQMVRRCQALYVGQAQRKGLRLVVEVDPALPEWLSGDVVRLTQVLLNLVGNAVKFTSEGEVALRVTALPAASADRAVMRFAVRDTGIGMSDEARARLFQPFSQGDGSTTRRYGGTGLGLFICKRLVALMNSRFEVESAPGRGSTFAFTVELARAERTVATPAPPAPRPRMRGRVLVAEDDRVNRVLMEHLLKNLGVAPEFVCNGREAVEATLRSDFDLVLMDCHMPEMDGFDATRAIRARERGARRTPVLACTAGVLSEEQARCLEAGMDDFLSKPIDQKRLEEALRRWLGPRDAAPDAHTIS